MMKSQILQRSVPTTSNATNKWRARTFTSLAGAKRKFPLNNSKSKIRNQRAEHGNVDNNDNDDNDEDEDGDEDDEEDDDEDFEIPIDINVTEKVEKLKKKAAEGKLKIYTQPGSQANEEQAKTAAGHDDATDVFNLLQNNAHDDVDDDGVDSADDDIITVTFGLYDPIPNDDLTFRMLLKDYIQDDICFGDANKDSISSSSSFSSSSSSNFKHRFALNEFCSLLSNQISIGTTIKGEGTDEPLGLLTALSFHSYARTLPMQQLVTFLTKQSPASLTQKVKTLLSRATDGVESVSLLINARLVNVPSELVAPLHQALQDDIAWARDNETDENKRSDLDPSRFILIARCFDSHYAAQSRLSKNLGDGKKKGKKKKKHERSNNNAAVTLNSINTTSEMLYYRFEEELYARKSEWSYRYPFHYNQREGEMKRRELPQECVVMCITREAVKQVVKELGDMKN